VSAGAYEAVDTGKTGNAVDVPYIAPALQIKCLERKVKAGERVNLHAAKRIVAVGRGFEAQEDLQLAEKLAAAIGGEVACTRPIAEEEKWMDKSRYIGVSGLMLKPDLYVGIGISGQVQHMVGVSPARTIIAINSDKNAIIFKQCDYGIVGDLKEVLPALIAKLGK
jgi:electron transfer flavoprotein alpha subunit